MVAAASTEATRISIIKRPSLHFRAVHIEISFLTREVLYNIFQDIVSYSLCFADVVSYVKTNTELGLNEGIYPSCFFSFKTYRHNGQIYSPPSREYARQSGFWKLANGGSDDKAGLEDQIESQSVESLGTLEYATSQSSSLTPNDSASQIQSSTLINPFLEPPKPKRQRKETSCNLQKHLGQKHAITSSQSSMLSYIRARPLQSPQELLDQNIFNWAIGTMQPFSTFDDPLFRQIWKNCSTIALSLDGWKSANGYKIFPIISHWIIADFQPQHRILDFQEIEGPDTSENLASIIYKVLCELDIKAKLISITGDNASNNLVMAEILHDLLKANYEQGNTQQTMRYQGEDSFIHCLAHILNLIVKEFLTVLKASDIAGDFQIIEDLKNNLSLAQSQKRVAESMPDKRDGFKTYLAAPQIQEYLKMNHILPPFTNQDWNQLGQIRIVLAEFDRYTLELSTDIPQISQSLAIYYQLFNLLQEVQDREGKFKDFDTDIANAAKSSMRKYNKYYTLMDDSCDILYITMLLDPRFKKLDRAQDIITAMQEQLETQYPITHKPELFTASEEPGPLATLQNPHKTIVSEMMNEYPRMAAAARDYLAVPAAEVDVERLFNTERDLLGLGGGL
ncbi:hypothetical protein TSTA_047440 [Talaromyces stipitatus ATCC 10500]|uniref:HAT C-terminal dimerisation domain-containing protein n=1 Tax=Talaromyces stipitatus (strain ATCC 10500 / CBS 375.48 / QM 6759 / NRRL 1006) TaxID=441959 RepID=B8MKE0_TALSN|nr:uncharacterized protein TSTA_047440 [Talaromyces stipitatus ATCC 10500]EED15295.1 hypothetical protein TSTA_047440 [Talaromyces stipitatus ATCC 10500]